MNDTWFKVIDFLQQNLWWGIGGSAITFLSLLVLAFVIPSGKKHLKKAKHIAPSESESGSTLDEQGLPEGVAATLDSYQEVIKEKEVEIADKTEQIEALDILISERSADLNLLNELPEELEEKITSTRKNIHTKYYWYGFLTSLAIAAIAFGVYYYLVVVMGK